MYGKTCPSRSYETHPAWTQPLGCLAFNQTLDGSIFVLIIKSFLIIKSYLLLEQVKTSTKQSKNSASPSPQPVLNMPAIALVSLEKFKSSNCKHVQYSLFRMLKSKLMRQ